MLELEDASVKDELDDVADRRVDGTEGILEICLRFGCAASSFESPGSPHDRTIATSSLHNSPTSVSAHRSFQSNLRLRAKNCDIESRARSHAPISRRAEACVNRYLQR